MDWNLYFAKKIEEITMTHSSAMIPLFHSAEQIDWSKLNTHNEVVSALLEEYSNAKKKKYTDLFLHSLHEPYSNGALYSLAVCKTFPLHKIGEIDSQKNCSICNSKPERKLDFPSRDLLTASFEGSENGNRDLYSLFLMLKTINSCNKAPKPTAIDFFIFEQILFILNNKEITMQEAISQIKKCDFAKKWSSLRKEDMKMQGKSTKNIAIRIQIKIEHILATLGVCGALNTENHKGAFYEYRKPTDLPRGKIGRSDLDYPVCWWNGRDGVNEEALEYWFHPYDEIVKS